MAKQNPKQESKHDVKVKKLAQGLKKQGWDVRAAVTGYEQPDTVGKDKYIPDIQATKKGAERLIEVETEKTIESDKKQQAAFRRRASHRPRTTFRIEKV